MTSEQLPYDRGKWISAVRERLDERAPTDHPQHLSADDRRAILLVAFLRAEHADWKTGKGSRLSKRGAHRGAGLRWEHVTTGDEFLVSEDFETLARTTGRGVEEYDLSLSDRSPLRNGPESSFSREEDEEDSTTAPLSGPHRSSLRSSTAPLSGHNLPKPPRNVSGGDGNGTPGSAVRPSPVGFVRELSRRLDRDDVVERHRELFTAATEAVSAGLVPDDVDLSNFEPTSSPAGLLATRIRRAVERGPRPVARMSQTASREDHEVFNEDDRPKTGEKTEEEKLAGLSPEARREIEAALRRRKAG